MASAGNSTRTNLATNIAVMLLVIIWLVPTLGLFTSSFRDRDQISDSGWWSAFTSVNQTFTNEVPIDQFSQSDDGVWQASGNVFDGQNSSGTIINFGSNAFNPSEFAAGSSAELRNGGTLELAANGDYTISRAEAPERDPKLYYEAEMPPTFTTDNYDTVMSSDGMDTAFMNTMIVTIPSTIIPILIAAFAAYALAWMEFPGRGVLIATVVGLLVVPLQLALVPLLRLHQEIGIGQSFLGIWLAHTGFGLPLAVYLLRNYMVGLPRDIIESARVDGATDFQIFMKIILPLSFPALASFAIFQFLWTWNDLLVAKVFLPSTEEARVMTVKIADDLLGSRGGDWGILAAAAFISIGIPILVFFAMQKYLVRGMLAGSVK